MDRKRRLALIFATVGIALGAGHIVQSGTNGAPRAASVKTEPTQVVAVSAGPQKAVSPLSTPQPAVVKPDVPTKPLPVTTASLTTLDIQPPAVLAAPVVDDCPVSLDLVAEPKAMIGITFKAPCAPNTRVVLRHAGLAITGKTSVTGALFASLPALDAAGEVSVTAKGAQAVTDSVAVPELASLRRFGVQWQADDAFQLHAFENGADYGAPGHISAAVTNGPSQGGFLTILGDASVNLPMVAEIYTFPQTGLPGIVVEAAITQKTCGRELLGETLSSTGGAATTMELTLATPDCTAIGDILVLNNLVADMTMAAAN